MDDFQLILQFGNTSFLIDPEGETLLIEVDVDEKTYGASMKGDCDFHVFWHAVNALHETLPSE